MKNFTIVASNINDKERDIIKNKKILKYRTWPFSNKNWKTTQSKNMYDRNYQIPYILICTKINTFQYRYVKNINNA